MQEEKHIRLIVKQDERTINEFRFTAGTIHIGRLSNNEIYLPDKTVSKQHAAIYLADDEKWMVEDLGSANKTYLNTEAVYNAQIKTGDVLRIADFTIEVNLEESTDADKAIPLEDTFRLEASLATPPHEIVVRRPDAAHAPAMRLAAKRLTDFAQATGAIAGVDTLEKLLPLLLDIMVRQFTAYHCWCAIRDQPTGPMTYQAGKRRDGKVIELSELILNDKINESIEKGQSLVLPRVSAQIEEKGRIRSALIAPILRQAGCFGLLYVDNAMVHEHYSLSDLDYLMLLAIHVAATLEKL